MSITDSILLLHMATVCYIIESMSSSNSRPHLYLLLMQIIISFPFLVVFLWTICRVAQCGILQHHLQHLLSFLTRAVMVKFYGSLIAQTQTVANYGAINSFFHSLSDIHSSPRFISTYFKS